MPAAVIGSARCGPPPKRSQSAPRKEPPARLGPPRHDRPVSGGVRGQWERGVRGGEANGSAGGGRKVRLREFRPRARSSQGRCGAKGPRFASTPPSAPR